MSARISGPKLRLYADFWLPRRARTVSGYNDLSSCMLIEHLALGIQECPTRFRIGANTAKTRLHFQAPRASESGLLRTLGASEANFSWAAIKGTYKGTNANLRFSAGSSGFLRFPAKICGFLQKSALLKCIVL